MSSSIPPHHQTLSVYVENKPGVLARVASLFSRRAFNIHSLAVAPTDNDDFSRMTIVVDVSRSPLEQIQDTIPSLITSSHLAAVALVADPGKVGHGAEEMNPAVL